VAEVSRKEEQLHPRVGVAKGEHQLAASIAAGVIDEYELAVAVKEFGDRAQAPMQLRKRFLLVENRNHERIVVHRGEPPTAPAS